MIDSSTSYHGIEPNNTQSSVEDKHTVRPFVTNAAERLWSFSNDQGYMVSLLRDMKQASVFYILLVWAEEVK